MARKKSDPTKGGPLQLGFFEPHSDWRPTPVSDLPSWKNASRIGFDVETRDPQLRDLGPGPRRDGYVVGYSFAIEGGPKHYVPFRHEGGGNVPEAEALRYLRAQFSEFEGEIVGANLQYDLDYILEEGVSPNAAIRWRDVQIADPLIYELHFSYNLLKIGERWGIDSKDDQLLVDAARNLGVDPKGGLWRLNSKFVGAYAERDVTSPLEIYEKQRAAIQRDSLQRVWDLETDVLPVLIKMKRRGVRIDWDHLDRCEREYQRRELESLSLIKSATGVNLSPEDVWKAEPMSRPLEAIGVQLRKTSSGAPQIDKELLGSLDHPVAEAMLKARKFNKMRTTFVSSIRRYATNGRIHCTFNQIARENESGDQKGARYGRLSAVDPNLQQQPSPDRDPDVAGEWRKNFLPEEDTEWGSCDYSQQEPRWTTHFAALRRLPKAEEAARRYREDPSTDNHDMMTRLIHGDEQVDHWLEHNPKEGYKVNRGYSKNIFLGLCYGEGGPKLCRDIGKDTQWGLVLGYGKRREVRYFAKKHDAFIERAKVGDGVVREFAGDEGQAIVDKFDAEVPYVRGIAQEVSNRAASKGFITTISGRRLHFPLKDDGSHDWTHKALNRLIQGTSADQMKKALVDIDREGHYLQLQVHDESNGSYAGREEANRVGEIMTESVLEWTTPLVPFKVDVEVGPSWGEAK